MADNSTVNINEQKQILRKHFREIRSSLRKETKELLDAELVSKITALKEFQNADTVLCYYPIKSEPDLLALFEEAKALGKTFAFPISHKDSHTLTFHAVDSLCDMQKGEYGIYEPNVGLLQISDHSNTLCIVPALAYDKSGHRLGYGGGYYDRFLANFNGISLGAVYSELFTESLPVDKFDLRVDIIITEKGEKVINEKKR